MCTLLFSHFFLFPAFKHAGQNSVLRNLVPSSQHVLDFAVATGINIDIHDFQSSYTSSSTTPSVALSHSISLRHSLQG